MSQSIDFLKFPDESGCTVLRWKLPSRRCRVDTEPRDVGNKRCDEGEDAVKSGEWRTNESPQRHFGGMMGGCIYR